MIVEAQFDARTNVLGLDLVDNLMSAEAQLNEVARVSRYPEAVLALADQLDEDMVSAFFGMRIALNELSESDSTIEFANTAYLIRASNFYLDQLGQSAMQPSYRAFLVHRAGRMLQGLEDRGITQDPFPGV